MACRFANVLIDYDSYSNRRWLVDDVFDEAPKHCSYTVTTIY